MGAVYDALLEVSPDRDGELRNDFRPDRRAAPEQIPIASAIWENEYSLGESACRCAVASAWSARHCTRP